MKNIIAIILSLIMWLGVYGQNSFTSLQGNTIEIDSISSVISSGMKELNMAGLSFALLEDGKVKFQNNYGYQNWEKQNPLNESNIFEAASMSKPVFAWLVMKLVERKLIDIDRPLYLYYEYEDISGDLQYKKITARHISRHYI